MICTPAHERSLVLAQLGVTSERLLQQRRMATSIAAWIDDIMSRRNLYSRVNEVGFFLTIPEATVYDDTLRGILGWFVCYHNTSDSVRTYRVRDLRCASQLQMVKTKCIVSVHASGRPRTAARLSPFDVSDAFHVNGKPITYFNAVPMQSKEFLLIDSPPSRSRH